jgi:hypothetical protein
LLRLRDSRITHEVGAHGPQFQQLTQHAHEYRLSECIVRRARVDAPQAVGFDDLIRQALGRPDSNSYPKSHEYEHILKKENQHQLAKDYGLVFAAGNGHTHQTEIYSAQATLVINTCGG